MVYTKYLSGDINYEKELCDKALDYLYFLGINPSEVVDNQVFYSVVIIVEDLETLQMILRR